MLATSQAFRPRSLQQVGWCWSCRYGSPCPCHQIMLDLLCRSRQMAVTRDVRVVTTKSRMRITQ